MIQLRLATVLRDSIEAAQAAGDLPTFDVPPFDLERPANKEHGDWSAGICLQLARVAGRAPRDIAATILTHLGLPEHVAEITIAGPGFINFTLSHAWLTGVVREVQDAGDAWGTSTAAEKEKIQVEFVSANPTGPMHLGHGRWAAIGDTLARLLEATGHEVEREFYVNDFGGQIRKLGESIAVRYLERFDIPGEIPEGGYKGAAIVDLAAEIAAEVGDRFVRAPAEERLVFMASEGKQRLLAHQRDTLERFGVIFNVWFSETTLHEEGAVRRVVEVLTELGHTYEAEGAMWLRTSDFGDDKDRVIVRSDGTTTYRAADLAYFLDKLRRGFDRIIYLWGADHHSAVREMQAGIKAMGEDPEHCEFLLGQFVHLVRGAETISMSKRQGEGVSFDELLEQVGSDAARYHFLRASMDQTVEFDLDVVVSQSQENPVYYVQYAHARICSIMRRATEQGIELLPVAGVDLGELAHPSEMDLLRKLVELPDAVATAARLRAPHRLARYAEELAALFHGFYRDCRVVSEDAGLTQARLHLALATRITLRNVLTVLGVSTPEQM